MIVIGFGFFGFFTANYIPVLFGVAAREAENAVAAVNDVLLAFAGFLFDPPIIGFIAICLDHRLYDHPWHRLGDHCRHTDDVAQAEHRG